MNDERKKWFERYNKNFGAREYLRFSCASLIWILVGVAITVKLAISGYSAGEYVFYLFLIMFLVFPFIALKWKPAYSLYRRILGNENLPGEPTPRSIVKTPHQSLPWLYYVLAMWSWLLGLLVLYFIIKYVLK